MKVNLKKLFKFDDSSNFFIIADVLIDMSGLSLRKFNKLFGSISVCLLVVYWISICQDYFTNRHLFSLDLIISSLAYYMIILMGLFKFIVIVRRKSTFFEIIDFIHQKSLLHESSRAFAIRKKAYDFYIKVTLAMTFLGSITFINFILFSPLSISEYAHETHPIRSSILYYVLFVKSVSANYISSMMTMGACYTWYTVMYALAMEFDICSLAFSMILMDDTKFDPKVKIDEIKNVIKAYQNLQR